jgi:hypothetical protein
MQKPWRSTSSIFLPGKRSEKNAMENIRARDFQSYSGESGRPFLPKPVNSGEIASMVVKTLTEM